MRSATIFALIPLLLMMQGCQTVDGGIVTTRKEASRKNADLDKLIYLKQGTKYADIVKEFGEPDARVGSGFFIVEYHLPDGRKIGLNFMGGNILQDIYEVGKDGAIRHVMKLDGSR